MMYAPANLQQHPLSAAFPAMQADDYQELADSIEIHGVLNPITTFEDKVLDGWHRYQCAVNRGIACPMVELDTQGFDSSYPRDFVLAQNKHRRHITAAQLAMATTAVYQWRPLGSNQHHAGAALSADHQKSSKQLAEISGVGVRTIEQAKAVQTLAVQEVQAAVKNGDVGLPKAAAIAKLPKAEQAAALKKPMPKSYPDIQDVEFREAEPEDTGPDADELAAQEAAEQADRATMQLLLDSDDKFATAVAEINRLKAEVFILKQSRNGYMNEVNAIKSLVKKRDYLIAQMNKEIEALKRGAE